MHDRPKDGNDSLPIDGEDDILPSILCAVSTGLGPASSDTTTDSVVVVVVLAFSAAALTVLHLRLCPIDDRGRLQQRGLLATIVFILFVTMFLRRPSVLAS